MIVVPNTDLLDDHQTELAEHLDECAYAVMSNTEYGFTSNSPSQTSILYSDQILSLSNLKEAIVKSDRLASGADDKMSHLLPIMPTALTTRLWQMSPRDPDRPCESDVNDPDYSQSSHFD